jgi:FKBP-type peptidyl-prolyl cis-trans isomerase
MHGKKIIALLLMATALGCGPKKPQEPTVIKYKDLEDPIIKANKQISREERQSIDAYVKRHKLDMVETGTGVQYMIYEKGTGIAAETGDIVVLDFDVTLLDGTLCYSSKKTGAEEFTVDYDNVESGLHEAIKYLHEGDQAIIIIPSHRAFGLAGDEDKIPPLSTVVYNLHLLKVIKHIDKKPAS